MLLGAVERGVGAIEQTIATVAGLARLRGTDADADPQSGIDVGEAQRQRGFAQPPGNHQCLLDPVTLALCVPDREIHFMGKKELFENKALGWVFRQVHGFPVDRGNMDMGAIRTAMGVLKAGETLGIFPEGTRSKSGHMLPLLGGASLLALKSGCDVVPVYIEGHYKPFRRMVVHVGKPIEMADLRAGRMNKETCDALTERMEAACARLSGGKSLPPAEKTPA